MTSPLILNQLGDVVGRAVADHPSRPRVLDLPPGPAPWSSGPDRDAEIDPADILRADILLTGPHPAWSAVRTSTPEGWPGLLRWIQSASTGVDWAPCWMRAGAPVLTCGRGHNAVQVAEHALAALLDHARGLERLTVRSRDAWDGRAGVRPPASLSGSALGLAGFGSIGQEIARRARAFGMEVRVWRRRAWEDGEAEAHGVVPVAGLRALTGAVDHLVLALPLTDETHRIVDAGLLAGMRPSLHLVNIARGGLIDHAALLAALDEERLAFASLDVTDPEPLPPGHPLYRHPRVRLTPHVAWAGGQDRHRLVRQIHANLDRFLDGAALSDVVDPARGY